MTETPSRLVFLDTETVGLDPRKHHPWEIAAIIREPGLPDEEIVWQLRGDLTEADEKSLEVCRYSERFAVPDGFDACRIEADGRHWRLARHELWLEVQAVLRGAHMVGAVPSFDAAMLTAQFQKHDFRLTWHHRLICVENMAAGLLGWPVPRGLGKTAEALRISVDPDGVHTALADARVTRDVYDAVLAGGTRD